MKAVILSGGKGDRLGDISKKIPKPMIKISGKPVLEHNILMCKKFGVKDLYINLHHLPELIQDYFGDGSKWGVNINYKYEEDLLGTAGTVFSFRDSLDSSFFVVYGDNFFNNNVDLEFLLKFHKEKQSDFTIVLSQLDDVSQSGIADLEVDGKIIRFIEKPRTNESNESWINAGIYLIEPEIFKNIDTSFFDFGKDVIPFLIRKNYDIYGYKMENRVIPIDTPELLRKTNNI